MTVALVAPRALAETVEVRKGGLAGFGNLAAMSRIADVRPSQAYIDRDADMNHPQIDSPSSISVFPLWKMSARDAVGEHRASQANTSRAHLASETMAVAVVLESCPVCLADINILENSGILLVEVPAQLADKTNSEIQMHIHKGILSVRSTNEFSRFSEVDASKLAANGLQPTLPPLNAAIGIELLREAYGSQMTSVDESR
jgi:hypothetical protein